MSPSTRGSDSSREPAHQHVVVHAVEEFLEIHVDHPSATHPGCTSALRTLRRVHDVQAGWEPLLCDEKVRSNRGCRIYNSACWMNRSSAVGMPSSRSPPSLFGMS